MILYKISLRSSNSTKEFRIDWGHSNREGLNCRTPFYWYIFLKLTTFTCQANKSDICSNTSSDIIFLAAFIPKRNTHSYEIGHSF